MVCLSPTIALLIEDAACDILAYDPILISENGFNKGGIFPNMNGNVCRCFMATNKSIMTAPIHNIHITSLDYLEKKMLEMNKLVSFAPTDIVLTNHKNKMEEFIYYTPALSLISRNVNLFGFVIGVCYASPPLNVVRVLCQNKAYDFIVAENNCKPYHENVSEHGIRINENIKNSFNKIAVQDNILTQYEADTVFELLLKENYRVTLQSLVDDVVDDEIWYRVPYNGVEYSLHQDLFTYCNEYVNYVKYDGWLMTGYFLVKYENKNKQQLVIPCLVNNAVFEKFEDFVPILYKQMYNSSVGE